MATRESLGVRLRRRLYGLVFLALLAGLVGLSIASYNKAFTKVVMVTLDADTAGNQLQSSADVKVRGVLVGEVRGITSRGDGARIKLALQPDRVDLIPSNVSARLLPKTLFGERYVSLVIPDQPDRPIKAGDVIGQDRSSAAIELEKVLSDVTPVLQALRPAELSATLNALAGALSGRGDQLGANLTQLNTYLVGLNPSLGVLVDDLDKLGRVAVVYNDAAPDLLSTLDNFRTTAATITDQRQALDSLLKSATTTGDVLRQFLADNGPRLIRLADTSADILAVLARYSPEYTCVLAALTKQEGLLNTAFQGGLHITLELIKDRGKYVPGDGPVQVTGVGPSCYGLPNTPIPFGGKDFPDGASSVGTSTVPTTLAGSAVELSMVKSVIGATSSTSPDQVPDVAALLMAPLLRGNEVVVP
jgi:phospholipid/cholesterol/gamma-HCH transport system substrate-binding protein